MAKKRSQSFWCSSLTEAQKILDCAEFIGLGCRYVGTQIVQGKVWYLIEMRA